MMLAKSQAKTLAEFLINLATAWLVAAIVMPSLTIPAFAGATLWSMAKGLFFGFASLILALYFSKE